LLAVEIEKRPRLVRIDGGGTAFLHPCGVCGSANAPFGFNVSLRKGNPGYWRCKDHRETGEGSTLEMARPPPKKTPEPVATKINNPDQGDLF